MKTSLFRFCGVLLLAAMLAPVCVHARKNPKNPKNNMRLLYWNIQNGMWSGQGDNYDKFVEWVRAYDPDVCVWCEAQSIYKTGTADKMDVADRYLVGNWGELAARYGHKYWYVGGHRDNYPQVITSKYPIENKGVLNNAISTLIFKELHKAGVKTHYIETINDRDQVCRRVTIIPLEVIVRNVIAGSMAQRLGIEEGTQPSNVIFDICYKKDELGDPLINDHHAVALGAATYEELNEMYAMTAKINEVLKELFLKMNIKLVDFKIEFGKTSDGEIVLADEVSPDTCRLWDATTNEKLDKDRFRRDLGKVREAYEEILARLQKIVG